MRKLAVLRRRRELARESDRKETTSAANDRVRDSLLSDVMLAHGVGKQNISLWEAPPKLPYKYPEVIHHATVP